MLRIFVENGLWDVGGCFCFSLFVYPLFGGLPFEQHHQRVQVRSDSPRNKDSCASASSNPLGADPAAAAAAPASRPEESAPIRCSYGIANLNVQSIGYEIVSRMVEPRSPSQEFRPGQPRPAGPRLRLDRRAPHQQARQPWPCSAWVTKTSVRCWLCFRGTASGATSRLGPRCFWSGRRRPQAGVGSTERGGAAWVLCS